jgi:hypothetical protein
VLEDVYNKMNVLAQTSDRRLTTVTAYKPCLRVRSAVVALHASSSRISQICHEAGTDATSNSHRTQHFL